jgi:LPS sulfotransferase NodH
MEEKIAKPIIICAQQRSGTTVLQRTMSGSPLIHTFGEIFHDKHYKNKKKDFNFFNYREKIFASHPELSFPNFQNQARLWYEYLENLGIGCQKEYFILDIKYNSWHHLSGVWQGILDIPNGLKMVKQKSIPVVHVIRKNIFLQYLSSKYAQKARTWHVGEKLKTKEVPAITLSIDPRDCLLRMKRSEEQTRLYKNWLKDYPQTCILFYEDMFENGLLSNQTLQKLNELMGRELEIPETPALKKIVKKPEQVVENKEEVLAFFKDSPYEEMVIQGLT